METRPLVEPEKVYSVSEITRLIRLKLESLFPKLWVEGEISNFYHHQSGHLYFTLKDNMSQLRTVMFRSEAQRVPFELKDGLQVIAKGQINVYEPRGEYQLLVKTLEPKGKGALQLAFEQLREKLRKEGLFDAKFKKKIPLLPKKVGIVTSPRGAAIIDIVRTLERRFAKLHIIIYPVKVQGEGAAKEIAEGVDFLGHHPDIDVIIVGRGGGSIEDLWAFNEEEVAQAIFRCPTPIISAVGHEIDFTIADFVADIRASTPSVAAEMVVDKEQFFEERIGSIEKRLIHHQQYFLQDRRSQVLGLSQHRSFQNMRVIILNLGQKVDELELKAWDIINNLQKKIAGDKSKTLLLEEKIRGHLREKLQSFLSRWERLSVQLHNLSPLNILKKGYALCWREDGQHLIRQIDEVEKEEMIRVSFYRGEFRSLVKEIDKSKRIESLVMRSKHDKSKL